MANSNTNWTTRYAAFATNKQSKFKPFSIRLSNDATLTGISYFPSSKAITKDKPLLVLLHGATCSAHAWDLSPDCTASIYSDLTGIPVVAINRPNFLGSSGWLLDDANPSPERKRFILPEDSSHFVEEGRWYHEYIFPALWKEFGVPNGCSAMATNSHSMSVPITIIAAGHYSQLSENERQYPWAGMAITGFCENNLENGSQNWAGLQWDPADLPSFYDPSIHIHSPKDDKIALMTGPEGCCDPAIRELVWQQNMPLFIGEVMDLFGTWPQRKKEFKEAVKIPVLHGLGSLDWLWRSDKAAVEAFLADFTNVPRKEGACIPGAPHAIEISPLGLAWWMRVFGFAAEVTTSKAMEKLNLPQYFQ